MVRVRPFLMFLLTFQILFQSPISNLRVFLLLELFDVHLMNAGDCFRTSGPDLLCRGEGCRAPTLSTQDFLSLWKKSQTKKANSWDTKCGAESCLTIKVFIDLCFKVVLIIGSSKARFINSIAVAEDSFIFLQSPYMFSLLDYRLNR